jgi:hypothetical protein
MSHIEIPLLRESAAFAVRLIKAASRVGDAKYQFHRRVNWSYRYDETFYEREADFFRSDPDAYLAGQQYITPQLIDVFVQKLRPKQVVTVLMKVAAHWIFHVLGSFWGRASRMSGVHIYRKCYVDDIELVFDPDEIGVIRAVYPFPLNIGRQLQYLRSLREKGYRFKLAGNPYSAKDLSIFLMRRDVRSLQRLESRAQVRHAHQVAALGVKTIQLSDEFDIGSLDFARTLARFPTDVVNSAHGNGKYYPIHAYKVFYVLTHRQQQYYQSVFECSYRLRKLNDIAGFRKTTKFAGKITTIRVVFLGQTSAYTGPIINNNEKDALHCLHLALADNVKIKLYYKHHPSNGRLKDHHGFEKLTNLDLVNNLSGTIYVSLFSSCQIDPSFKGRKILLRSHLIYPEIAFDDSEEIKNIDELIEIIRNAASAIT